MKNTLIFALLLITKVIFAQNFSAEYAAQKGDIEQNFILDVFPNYSYFYSAEYCETEKDEIFNYIKVEKNNIDIIYHDEIEGLKVFFKPSIDLKWKIHHDSKIEGQIILYKASTEYKGIEYVGWYDPKIAISDGPFIFNGLPGLIHEIESDDIRIQLVKLADENIKCVDKPTKEKEISQETYRKYNEELLSIIKDDLINKVDIFDQNALKSVLSSAIKKDIFRAFLY